MAAGEAMTIGALAEAAAVGVETIRFYQRQGLLREPARTYGRVRRYGAADVSRVRFVKSAQRTGFSVVEVAELLRLDDGTHCSDARALAEQKLVSVRERLEDLRRIEVALSRLIRQCRGARGMVSCPLIASLHEG